MVDPHRDRPTPAPLLVGDVSPDREEDAAVIGQDINGLQRAAGDPLARGDAKRLLGEPFLEDERALFRLVVGARGQGQLSAAEVPLDSRVEGSVEGDGLAEARLIGPGGHGCDGEHEDC